MKKPITPVLLTLILLASCTGRQTQKPSPAKAEDSLLEVSIDSIGINMTLKSDIPQDTLLLHVLAQFVCEQMFFETDNNDRPLKPLPVCQGDFRDFLHRCAARKWDELAEATFGCFPTLEEIDADPENDGISRQEMQQQAAELTATDSIYQTCCEMTFRQVAENDSTVTWLNEYDIYVANTAHPSVGAVRLTLRKKDGSIVSSQEEERKMESPEPTEVTMTLGSTNNTNPKT